VVTHVDKEAKDVEKDAEVHEVLDVEEHAVEVLPTETARDVERGLLTKRRAMPSWVQSHPFGTTLPWTLRFWLAVSLRDRVVSWRCAINSMHWRLVHRFFLVVVRPRASSTMTLALTACHSVIFMWEGPVATV
jgi:hypothetical protein